MSAPYEESSALIVGCGYVGTLLGELLYTQGYTCFGLRRDPSKLPPSIQPLRGDVTRPEELELPPHVDCLIYAVGAKEASDEQYSKAYVQGLQNVLSKVESVTRLIFVSSTAVYEQEDSEWVDENSPAEPRHFTGRRLLEAEALALSVPGGIVVRAAGIYGPGRVRLLNRVRTGQIKSSELGSDQAESYTNRIHQLDLARALTHLAELEAPEKLYLAVDRLPATYAAVVHWMEQRTQTGEVQSVVQPADFSSAAPGPHSTDLRVRADAQRRQRRTNKRCSSLRLQQSGFEFTYPTFREGYEALLASS